MPTPPANPETGLSDSGKAGDRQPPSIVTHGDVSADDVEYALKRLGTVLRRITEPIPFTRVKLTKADDPARTRPSMAQVLVDVDGDLVRAQIAAETMPLAIDLLQRRLRDQLDHRAQRRETMRSAGTTPEPGEWRHGDTPTIRPEFFDRPTDERQLIRRKTFAIEDLTPEEAAWDMEQMDFDFYLFRDLQSGEDTLVERREDGVYRLTQWHPHGPEPEPEMERFVLSVSPPPRVDVDEAIRRLEAIGEPYLFFADAERGRGHVIYHRYDGHYGLIGPA
jgi:ribosome-associated translation inhibitor RaiA